jgi:hypothetical protein
MTNTLDLEMDELFGFLKQIEEDRTPKPTFVNPITEDFVYGLVESHIEKLLEVFSWEKMTEKMFAYFMKLNLEVTESRDEKDAEGYYNFKTHTVVLHSDVIARTAQEKGIDIKALAEDVLVHELRHVWQFTGGFPVETIKEDLKNPVSIQRKIEVDAVTFAYNYCSAYGKHRK